jgi:hypothetical protein
MSLPTVTSVSAGGAKAAVGRFGLLFPDGDRFTPSDDELKLLANIMTAQTHTDDSRLASGYTLLGQFITHDLTLDDTPQHGVHSGNNVRTPALDLDSVYGQSQRLDEPAPRDDDKMKIERVESGGVVLEDLPRYAEAPKKEIKQFTAIIGDIRNDENVLIGQLHLAFLKLHNRFVGDVEQGRFQELDLGETTFDRAQRLCQWHYQWVVVNDFLPRIVGKETVDRILKMNGNEAPTFKFKLYPSADFSPPDLPYEFAAAAFRFGHSMIRPAYFVAESGTTIDLFGGDDSRGLAGRTPINSRLKVDWPRFFVELPPSRPIPNDSTYDRNFAKKIDSHLPTFLGNLPPSVVAEDEEAAGVIRSLALLDLIRSRQLDMRSGQQVAEIVHAKLGTGHVLSNEDLNLPPTLLQGGLPLWFYILREAEVTKDGQQLGLVGGRIVAEVILALLAHDRKSYLNVSPAFQPTIKGGPIDGVKFRMADLLRLAGAASPTEDEIADA